VNDGELAAGCKRGFRPGRRGPIGLVCTVMYVNKPIRPKQRSVQDRVRETALDSGPETEQTASLLCLEVTFAGACRRCGGSVRHRVRLNDRVPAGYTCVATRRSSCDFRPVALFP